MNKIIKEKLVQIIKEKYKNNQNIALEDKIDLNTILAPDFDPSLDDYKKEIYNSLKNKLGSINIKQSLNAKNKMPNEISDVEDIEEIEEVEEDGSKAFDLEIIEKIDSKVLSILHHLNLSIYDKSDLKSAIINDMIEYLFSISVSNNNTDEIIESIPDKIDQERYIVELKKIGCHDLKLFFTNSYLTDENDKRYRYLNKNLSKYEKLKIWCVFNSILWYIENHIEYEFKEYENRKNQIKKDLVVDLITRIAPDIDKRIKEHKQRMVKKINRIQQRNFLNFLLEEIDNKYIKSDKKEKKLNNEDYLFLKEKVKVFITKKYLEQ